MNITDRVSVVGEMVGDLYLKHGSLVDEIHEIKSQHKTLGDKLWLFKNKFSEWWDFYKLKKKVKKKNE